MGIGKEEETVGHLLSRSGYFTGWIGKFHLGADRANTYVSPLSGAVVSEEEYLDNYAYFVASEFDSLSGADAQAYLEGPVTDAHREIEEIVKSHIQKNLGFDHADYIYRGNMDYPINRHNMDWLVEGALEFLDSSQEQIGRSGLVKPFYLHFNTTLMHGPVGQISESMHHPNISGRGWLPKPIKIDPSYMDSRDEIFARVAAAGLDTETAAITWLDEGVGAVMKKLDELGLTENTVFVFVSDHGTINKATLFSRDGTNVPMIVRYPALTSDPGVNKDVECIELVQNIDFVPTVLDLAGVTSPETYGMDGKSFRSLLEDPLGNQAIHEHLFFQVGHARGILKGDFKYIVTRFSQERLERIEKGIADNKYREISRSPAKPSKRLIRDFGYMGTHPVITSRGMEFNPAYLDFDQIYRVGPLGAREAEAEKLEGGDTKNLLAKPNGGPDVSSVHTAMIDVLESELQYLNADSGQMRPFGEFDTGFGPSTSPVLSPEVLKLHDFLYGFLLRSRE